MSDQTINLTPDVYRYLLDNSLREHPVLQQLREETHKLTQFRMQISPEQGQLMQLLIELLQAKKALEIGTFTGYSALSVALALPPNGQLITCDVSTEWTKMAKIFWQKAGVANKIDLRLGPGLNTLDQLIAEGQSNTFDFAFIDADKANYDGYYEKALLLLKKGGLIAIDNVLWSGRVADPNDHDETTEIFRQLNAKLVKDERVSLSMIPIGDGLTLAYKRV